MLGYGVDLTVHEIASRLTRHHGMGVDIWTPTSDGTFDHGPYKLREIIVYGAPVNRALPLLELNCWRALRGLKRRLRDAGEHYDVVVPCTHPYYGAGRALGVPQVFFNFGNVPTMGFTWKGRANWAWLDFSERVLHKPRSVRIVSISRFLHEQQSDALRRRGTVIHLGGDHYYPAPAGAHQQFRARHGIAEDAVVLGFCGRLHQDHPPYKGTREVLKLGRSIRAAVPGAQLLMCGVGSPADEEWIRAEGALPLINLPPAEMPSFYSALDVYVCASRWEGFNLPIVEAAWHGVPALAYDAGAHGEHVTAVLVPDGDFAALTERTLELVKDAGRRARAAAEARQRAQQFSWDSATERFAAVLSEVAR